MPDHCTLWPDTVWGIYIGACCAAHDIAYGGDMRRDLADKALGECLAELGLPFTGFVMVVGVTTAGWLFRHRQR